MKWLDPSILEDFIWAQSLWPSSYSSFIYNLSPGGRRAAVASAARKFETEQFHMFTISSSQEKQNFNIS